MQRVHGARRYKPLCYPTVDEAQLLCRWRLVAAMMQFPVLLVLLDADHVRRVHILLQALSHVGADVTMCCHFGTTTDAHKLIGQPVRHWSKEWHAELGQHCFVVTQASFELRWRARITSIQKEITLHDTLVSGQQHMQTPLLQPGLRHSFPPH